MPNTSSQFLKGYAPYARKEVDKVLQSSGTGVNKQMLGCWDAGGGHVPKYRCTFVPPDPRIILLFFAVD